MQDGRRQLVALIYRVKGNDRAAYEAGDMNKETEYLSVVRPTESGACTLGLATTNDAAHALADGEKSCKAE